MKAPRTATAAGVTPESAAPGPASPDGPASAAGRPRAKGPGTVERERAGMRRRSSFASALDLALLPPQIPGVLHRRFDAGDVERPIPRRISKPADCRPPAGPPAAPPAAAATGSPGPDPRAGVRINVRPASARLRSNRARRAWNRSHRSSSTRPTSRPRGVSRRSALSMRSSSRCSARDVNIRYGSRQPFVIRSSTRMPMYASSRRSSRPTARAGDMRRVRPGDQALRRRLLVAGRPVDLPRQEQPGDPLRLEAPRELGRLDEVVLDGIAGTEHHGVFEARQARERDPPARRAAGSSRSRSRRSRARRRLPAPGRSGGAPCRGSGRSCPRATGSSAARSPGSAR